MATAGVEGGAAPVGLPVVATDFPAEIAAARATFEQIEAVSNPDALRARVAKLEAEASAPNLWDDQDNAQAVTSALSLANGELERLASLSSRLDDLEVLVTMAEEGDDAETLAEADAELASLRKDLAALEIRTLMTGEWDERNAVITIRSGAGGVDAADFAAMLLRMYLRWAERHGYDAKVLDTSYAEEAGLKSATVEINAPYAFGTLSVEAGTHRLVRISPFDNQGRRQTSFAAVEVIPLIESTDHIEIPESDIKVDVFRSSGPGGQSVNTTDSAVRITHLPTGIVVAMQNEKSQLQNREAGMRVLRARILARYQEEADAEASAYRKSQIRTMDRSERIRTYNFPQGRVTDHRINLTLYNLARIIEGDSLDDVINPLIAEDQAERLASLEESFN